MCTGLQGRQDFLIASETGHHQHSHMRLPGSDLPGGFNAIHFGHEQVHQNDIRFQLQGKPDGIQSIVRLADHLDIFYLCQEGFDASADDPV